MQKEKEHKQWHCDCKWGREEEFGKKNKEEEKDGFNNHIFRKFFFPHSETRKTRCLFLQGNKTLSKSRRRRRRYLPADWQPLIDRTRKLLLRPPLEVVILCLDRCREEEQSGAGWEWKRENNAAAAAAADQCLHPDVELPGNDAD